MVKITKEELGTEYPLIGINKIILFPDMAKMAKNAKLGFLRFPHPIWLRICRQENFDHMNKNH